ncbi:MAG TPA: hypothetical protein VF762_18055 [Blastocatellia bacterium]|jgi:YVTN family beta-propeller protein
MAKKSYAARLQARTRPGYTASGLSSDVAVIDAATDRVITTARLWGIAMSR